MRNNLRKRGGRPKKQAEPGSMVKLGIIMPAELKTRLDNAAVRSGRSQSAEATRRLRASFEWQPLLDLIAAIEDATGSEWQQDGRTRDLAICVVGDYFRAFGPHHTKQRSKKPPLRLAPIAAWAQGVCDKIEDGTMESAYGK